MKPALEGIICAYHFPKCIHDFHEQEKICMRTCDNVMKFCRYRPPDCEPGSNVTLVDGQGQPILDENGLAQTVACNQTASYFDQAQAAGEAAGTAAAGAAQSADDATGGALSSGAASAGDAASSAASSASDAASSASDAASEMGGRRSGEADDVIGGGYNSLEMQRREAIYQALRGSDMPEYLQRWFRPPTVSLARKHFVQAHSGDPMSLALRQAAGATAETAAETASAGAAGEAAAGTADGVDTSELYYARFQGKVTLSHFAQVGARCDACLEKADMLDGKECNGPEEEGRDSDHWKCAYNTRYDNGDCTADSRQTCSPVWALSMVLVWVTVAFATRSTN